MVVAWGCVRLVWGWHWGHEARIGVAWGLHEACTGIALEHEACMGWHGGGMGVV